MTAPDGVIETRAARVWLCASGVVQVVIQPDVQQSLSTARENLEAAARAAGGRKRPILVDIRHCVPLTPQVRSYYGGERTAEWFTAQAVLINASPLGRMIGNIYLRVAKPVIPARLFTAEAPAHRWLVSHLQT